MRKTSLFPAVIIAALVITFGATAAMAEVNVQVNGYLPAPPGVHVYMEGPRPYYVQHDRRVYVERDRRYRKHKGHRDNGYRDHGEGHGRDNGHGGEHGGGHGR
jgi:hypothetical protein